LGIKSFTNPKGEVSKLNGKGRSGEPNFSGQTAGEGNFFFVQIGFSSIKSPHSSRKPIKIFFFGNYEISPELIRPEFQLKIGFSVHQVSFLTQKLFYEKREFCITHILLIQTFSMIHVTVFFLVKAHSNHSSPISMLRNAHASPKICLSIKFVCNVLVSFY
jgi:hypothetical protein